MFTTAGLQVPDRPLFEVVGSTGGVVPAQNGGILLKLGVYTGLDKMRPVFSCVVHPFASNSKFEYTPALRPVTVICPDAFATRSTGPTKVPSSI